MHPARNLLCLILLFAILSPPILAQQETRRLFIQSLQVASKKKDNKSWDAFGGEPDLMITIYKWHRQDWKKVYQSPVFHNTFQAVSINTKVDLPLKSTWKIQVEDKDLTQNDLIGTHALILEEKDWSENPQKISFSSVTSLRYIFSSFQTPQERRVSLRMSHKWKKTQKLVEKQKQQLAKQQAKIQEQEKIIQKQQQLLKNQENSASSPPQEEETTTPQQEQPPAQDNKSSSSSGPSKDHSQASLEEKELDLANRILVLFYYTKQSSPFVKRKTEEITAITTFTVFPESVLPQLEKAYQLLYGGHYIKSNQKLREIYHNLPEPKNPLIAHLLEYSYIFTLEVLRDTDRFPQARRISREAQETFPQSKIIQEMHPLLVDATKVKKKIIENFIAEVESLIIFSDLLRESRERIRNFTAWKKVPYSTFYFITDLNKIARSTMQDKRLQKIITKLYQTYRETGKGAEKELLGDLLEHVYLYLIERYQQDAYLEEAKNIQQKAIEVFPDSVFLEKAGKILSQQQ